MEWSSYKMSTKTNTTKTKINTAHGHNSKTNN